MKTELKNSVSQLKNSGERRTYKKKEPSRRETISTQRQNRGSRLNKEYFLKNLKHRKGTCKTYETPRNVRYYEGEVSWANGIDQTVNKSVEGNFPKIRNNIPMQIEVHRAANRQDQKKKHFIAYHS